MKKITPFTREEILELFEADGSSPSGLKWRVNYKQYKKWDVAGYLVKVSGSKTYGSVWHACFNGRPHLVHRVIWVLERGEIPPGYEIDHINGDPSDNRLENLSLKTRAHNSRARVKMNPRNSSGFTGVRWSTQRNKWQGRCFRDYKEYHCGFFENKDDAARAVDAFAQKWADDHGEEFRLHNFKN